ncbi:DUF58 domain-containing protein [Guyparkeria sp. SCN-R1]|uniref:DUF58 domain-containing protein n=1 Tax=Guyparkeria sp. SCN-R1 TaxID=2341113 RepID=UPI000F64A2A3|nr:DUF58 domain-containing protein [Guyparkeria sp. SCN-R1]RRQ20293.1 DUF58 domain-containing protein [Guyparkeria sp. SCN-R1]
MSQQTLSSLQIRPRRFGLGLAVITVAMLLAAINYGNNLIFLIAFMMIALMINSAWQGWRALSAVQARVIPPGMRPAGEPGSLSVEFTSQATLPPLRVDAGLEETAAHTALCPPGATIVAITLPGEPRGYLPLPEMTLETPYPLGLWTVRRGFSPGIGQWVHPAPIEGIDRAQRTENDQSGDQASLEGDPTRLRSYHPGDPIRHVVFRHYAKTGQLLTRHPEADSERPDPELVDYEAFAGPRETRLSAMTARLMDLNRDQRPWVLRLPGEDDLTASASANLAQRYQTALQRLTRFGRERDDQGFDHVVPGEID